MEQTEKLVKSEFLGKNVDMAVVTQFEICLIISLKGLRKTPLRLADIGVKILTRTLRSTKQDYCRIARRLQCMYISTTNVEMYMVPGLPGYDSKW